MSSSNGTRVVVSSWGNVITGNLILTIFDISSAGLNVVVVVVVVIVVVVVPGVVGLLSLVTGGNLRSTKFAMFTLAELSCPLAPSVPSITRSHVTVTDCWGVIIASTGLTNVCAHCYYQHGPKMDRN